MPTLSQAARKQMEAKEKADESITSVKNPLAGSRNRQSISSKGQNKVADLSNNPLTWLSERTKQENESKDRASWEASEKAKSNYLEGATPYTGRFYPWLTARMFGTRQVDLRPKFAYVYEVKDKDGDGNEVVHYVTNFRTRKPHRRMYGERGAEAERYVEPFKTEDGTRLPGEKIEMLDNKIRSVKTDMHVVLDDHPQNIMRPEPGAPLTYKGRRIRLPPGAIGIVARTREDGTQEPYVRDWFPYTMGWWGKDMAFEDQKFIHHTDHVYAELAKLMAREDEREKKGYKRIPYNKLRMEAEMKVRTGEARGLYNNEVDFDWNKIKVELYKSNLEAVATKLADEKFGSAPSLERKQYIEALMNDDLVKREAKALTDKRNDELQDQARKDLEEYERISEEMDRNYAYFEAQFLDDFWYGLEKDHPGFTIVDPNEEKGLTPSDPGYNPRLIYIKWPATEDEIYSYGIDQGHLKKDPLTNDVNVIVDFKEIERLNTAMANEAMSQFAKIYSSNSKLAKERMDSALGLEAEYAENQAILQAEEFGVEWEDLSPEDRERLMQDQRNKLMEMPIPKKVNTLAQFQRGLEVAKEEEEQAAQAELDEQARLVERENERQLRQELAEQRIANAQELAAKAKKADLRLAESQRKFDAGEPVRLVELRNLAKAASEKASLTTRPLKDQLNNYRKTLKMVSDLQSNMDKVFDSFSVSKVVNRLRQNMVNVRTGKEKYGLMDGNSKTMDAATALVDDLLKYYNLVNEGDPSIRDMLAEHGHTEIPDDENGTITPPEQLMRKLTEAIKWDIATHGRPTYPDRTGKLQALAYWMTANSKKLYESQKNAEIQGVNEIRYYPGDMPRTFFDTPIEDLDLRGDGTRAASPRLLGEYVHKLLGLYRTTADELEKAENSEENQDLRRINEVYQAKEEQRFKDRQAAELERRSELPTANDSWISMMKDQQEMDDLISNFPEEIDYTNLLEMFDETAYNLAENVMRDALARKGVTSEDIQRYMTSDVPEVTNMVKQIESEYKDTIRSIISTDDLDKAVETLANNIMAKKHYDADTARHTAENFIKNAYSGLVDVITSRYPEMDNGTTTLPAVRAFMSNLPRIFKNMKYHYEAGQGNEPRQADYFNEGTGLTEKKESYERKMQDVPKKLSFVNADLMQQLELAGNAAKQQAELRNRGKLKGNRENTHTARDEAIKAEFYKLHPNTNEEVWREFWGNYDLFRNKYLKQDAPAVKTEEPAPSGTPKQGELEKYQEREKKLSKELAKNRKLMDRAIERGDQAMAGTLNAQIKGLTFAMDETKNNIRRILRGQMDSLTSDVQGKAPVEDGTSWDDLDDYMEDPQNWNDLDEYMGPDKAPKNEGEFYVAENPSQEDAKRFSDSVKDYATKKYPNGNFVVETHQRDDGFHTTVRAMNGQEQQRQFFDERTPQPEPKKELSTQEFNRRREQSQMDKYKSDVRKEKEAIKAEQAKAQEQPQPEPADNQDFTDIGDTQDQGELDKATKERKQNKDAKQKEPKQTEDSGSKDPVKKDPKEASMPDFENIFKSEKQERYNRYQGVMSNMTSEDDPLSFRNMLKKANDEQASKRGAPPLRNMGPNVCGGTMPNFGPSDRDATTPIDPEIHDEQPQGASKKEIKI